MARRCRLRRFFASLLGVWFASLSMVPAALRPCVMHVPAAASSHASHASHASPASAPDAPAPRHPCDCLTSCCDAPVATHVSAVRLREVPVQRATARVSVITPERLRPAPSARLLPFANGPPALISG